MKKLLCIILLMPLVGYSQKVANQSLVKTSEVYSAAYLLLDMYSISFETMSSAMDEKNGKVCFVDINKKQTFMDYFSYCSPKTPCSYCATFVFKVNNNLAIAFASRIIGNKIEAAILYRQNGDIYEYDYGVVDKNRLQTDDNTFYEKANLPQGAKILINERQIISAFINKGGESYLMPIYTCQ